MKSNKGFTLIELLAVIVILAIIALIATPVILNIINESKTKANRSDAKLVVQSVEMAYSTWQMKNNAALPKLSQIKTEFTDIMDNVTWTDASNDDPATIVTDNGITCTITTTFASNAATGTLSIACDDADTTTSKTLTIAAES